MTTDHTDKSSSRDSFDRSPYASVKHTSYFQVYDRLFSEFRGRPITFVEVGVLGGGSLFMWRDFFGPQARIIGCDANPNAVKWRDHGFEIFIGDQSDPRFWTSFFETVGAVDILLDDGGHQNHQQIVTASAAIPHINDGGLVVVEDMHTSYMRGFGNPSRFSFVNWSRCVFDQMMGRFPALSGLSGDMTGCVFAVHSFESILCFEIDRRKCFQSQFCKNDGIYDGAADASHGWWLRKSQQIRAFFSRLGFDAWGLSRYFRVKK